MNDSQTRKIGRGPGKTWLGWLAGLALVAGLATGGISLASAIGIWLGLWDFRAGFAMLQFVGDFGLPVAAATFLAAIVVYALARRRAADDALRLSALALVGTVAAGLGYYVPASYVPGEGENVPPIHDISTDTVNPPDFVAVLPLRADAPNTTEYGGSDDMTPERLAQLQTGAYPDLTTRTLSDAPDIVFERALAAVDRLGWELVAQVPAEGRIEATDTTFWYRFKDDVVIRIQPAPDGTIVDARSVSRVGRGDAGTNARRLRAFFDAL